MQPESGSKDGEMLLHLSISATNKRVASSMNVYQNLQRQHSTLVDFHNVQWLGIVEAIGNSFQKQHNSEQ